MSADANFEKLNLLLPPAPKAMGVYKAVVVVGSLVYVSGHGPLKPDGTLMTGPEIVATISRDFSVGPRVLLAQIEAASVLGTVTELWESERILLSATPPMPSLLRTLQGTASPILQLRIIRVTRCLFFLTTAMVRLV